MIIAQHIKYYTIFYIMIHIMVFYIIWNKHIKYTCDIYCVYMKNIIFLTLMWKWIMFLFKVMKYFD